MSLVCSITGNPIVHGVICKKTGHVYEQSTITKQIKTTGKCPHTKQSLELDDLVKLRVSNPTVAQNYSDPIKLIQKMKEEYENALLESYYLKKSVQEAQQQLAYDLYQHDASIRVITNLEKELNKNHQEIASLIAEISNVQHS